MKLLAVTLFVVEIVLAVASSRADRSAYPDLYRASLQAFDDQQDTLLATIASVDPSSASGRTAIQDRIELARPRSTATTPISSNGTRRTMRWRESSASSRSITSSPSCG